MSEEKLNHIQQWHIVISGFTQHEGALHGCERLELKLRSIASPSVYVGLRTWRNDWAKLAEKMDRASAPSFRVYIYAYSWGAGNGFTKLAKELKARGLGVTRAVLCDPVYCSPAFSAWPGVRWLARGTGVLARRPIRVPENVGTVEYFTQAGTFPRGSDLVATRHSRVTHLGQLPYAHNEIDDSREFHDRALEVAGVK